MNNARFIDICAKQISEEIDLFFPGWEGKNERLCVLSPHDDDAIIGAGYAISTALDCGAEVFVFIFCRGNAGYSKISEKDNIESTRRAETFSAYEKLGVKKENIISFDYSDFGVLKNIGWIKEIESGGSFKQVLTALRENRITRVLVPNHYREHVDHYAVNIIGSFDTPQSGDPILVDWGRPQVIKSIAEYSVWADLSPEDALTCRRSHDLRANRIIAVDKKVEEKVCEGISEYKSQGKIIKGLIEARRERMTESGEYIEVYLSFDPRPKLDFAPYIRFIDRLETDLKDDCNT